MHVNPAALMCEHSLIIVLSCFGIIHFVVSQIANSLLHLMHHLCWFWLIAKVYALLHQLQLDWSNQA